MAIKSKDTTACEEPRREMIEEFRMAKQRQRVRQAMRLWNRAEAQGALSLVGRAWPDVSKSGSVLAKVPSEVRNWYPSSARRPDTRAASGESECDPADPRMQDGARDRIRTEPGSRPALSAHFFMDDETVDD
jgi:hypothetical protein